MCLTENFVRARVGKHLYGMFRIRNSLKQGDALSLLLSEFALEYTIKNVRTNQEGLRLNGAHQLLVYADDAKI